ncbi:PAS domain-containing protein [bacterium]|nr:PAS domain-containing protein [bacterium]
MDNQRNYSPILFYRGLIYIALVAFIGVFHSLLFGVEGSRSISNVYFVLTLVTGMQFLFSFKMSSQEQLLALFLADSAAAMLLVRETGGSASPFTLLFPVLSLSGAVLLEKRSQSWALIVIAIVLMSFAVGMRPAIIGNALAILGTTLLGQYLTAKLKRSDEALELSEEARRRLENIQRAILTNIPSGLMSVDTFGKIIQVNSVGAAILGQSENSLMGMYLRDLMPELDELRDSLHTMYPVVGDFSEKSSRKVVCYKSVTGEFLNLGYSLARLNDPEDRSPIGTLVVFQDLTHVMKIEEDLRMSEKLAAVGKLAAGIAHEIRNPLAGISGSAQLLEGSSYLEQEDKQLLNIIQRESQRLDGLITEFLNYVRPTDAKLEGVELNQLAHDVVESLQVNPIFKDKGCKLQLKKAPVEELWVEGDRNKLVQVLINLIINAAQANATQVSLEVQQPGRLQVWDNGSGIKEENINRVFEPFFTTKDKGTGLGLALSYKLIEAMGGSVKVRSPIPEQVDTGGSMFTIELRGANIQDESAAV